MRLTKADKEAFVRAVMDDVPKVDYDEQAKKLVMEELVERMPAEVKAVYKTAPEWLTSNYICLRGNLQSFYGPVRKYTDTAEFAPRLSEKLSEKLSELSAAKKEQTGTHNEIRAKVRATIDSCTTLKQAKERLPEFEKYLPTERGSFSTANLPAVTNLVADLMNLGWPKTQETNHGRSS